MPRLYVRIVLFLSSYAPLLALFGVRRRHCVPELIALEATAVVSVLVLWLFVRMQRGYADTSIKIESWDTKDADTLGYIATYLIPLLSLNLGNFDDVLALGVFAVVLGVVYCNSSLIYTNPMLSLMGYHLFEVKESDGPIWTLLSRRKHLNLDQLMTSRVGDTMIRVEE
jgi:hypothetical protein